MSASRTVQCLDVTYDRNHRRNHPWKIGKGQIFLSGCLQQRDLVVNSLKNSDTFHVTLNKFT